MFDSLFQNLTSVPLVLLVLLSVAIAFAGGLVAAFIESRRMRSSKGFFVAVSLIPAIVAGTFATLNVMLLNDTTTVITSIAAIMVGLGLIRFRSAQGTAEEMIALFIAVAVGAINGLGYWALGSIIAVVLPLVYLLLSILPIFKNKRLSREKMLKITIPENLEYSDAFNETFEHYLKECEPVGVKTTGMGSMFRLSYRIVMKNPAEEKELIDELRIKNGNLEISVLPYTENDKSL